MKNFSPNFLVSMHFLICENTVKIQSFSRLPQFSSDDRRENIASNITEFNQYCKDGTIKTIEVSTKLILNKETDSVDVLGVSRDVTYKKNLNLKTDYHVLKSSFNSVYKLLKIDNDRIYCFGKLLVYSRNTPVKCRT